ncbi:response regulator [Asticcacaulis sp. BYS171W]|uniref:Response regulator n=1 Tax=Asticcacaulis aquaticus TaxID=2984212 RepID=A0ABT5HU39_9CAUL|nr:MULTISPECIES: response regulator [Asticcacaulis]ESQ79651.1 Fis family transcriptional regulator [Asticcacaulis sp. YBE204]MDC7683580.1 response regulator [Asticcacaulis aquaticus]
MSLTALFLDDDADILASAELVLARQGFTFLKAQTPDEARAVLDAQPVDILLLDLNYRRGDTSGEAGLAFLQERLAKTPDLAVVIVTGHSGMSIAIQAMRMGAQDFVVKPWNNDRFLASIRAAIDTPRRVPTNTPPKDLNLERSERDLIKAALERHQFNISSAAKDLGLTRAALYRRMEKHGL